MDKRSRIVIKKKLLLSKKTPEQKSFIDIIYDNVMGSADST